MSSNDWEMPDGEAPVIRQKRVHRFLLEPLVLKPLVTEKLVIGALVVCLGVMLGWAVWPRAQVRFAMRAAAQPSIPAVAARQAVPGSVPTIGMPAPDFTLPALHHDPQTLADWRGQPVLINFWASWCGPCRREMPDLIAAYAHYQSEGLVVLAVNLTHQDSRANAEAFAEEFQIPFPVLLDETGEIADDLYGARALPMSFFIDPAGNVRHIYIGAVSRAWIDQVMAE